MGKYTHYNNVSFMEGHKLAFTLAEALMTLAIIGVIAMLVIPTAVISFKTKIWNSANETFTKKLDNAIQDMHTQNTLGGHQDTMSFVAELSKNFKINKICANDEIISCFEDTIYWDDEQVDMSKIKDAADLGQDDWETETVGVMFANGVTGVIAYNPDCDFDNNTDEASTASCIAILYDVDGFKKPNTQLKDLRSINVLSLGGNNCAFEINGTCFTAPFTPTPLTLAECQVEVEKGTLGIKECSYSTDYWAGAVKTCGGVSKMPTLAQIADIANYVYNTSGIGADTSTSGSGGINVDLSDSSSYSLDDDKAETLGFNLGNASHSSFLIWSAQENTKTGSSLRYFFPGNTFTGNVSRSTSQAQAVCIGD